MLLWLACIKAMPAFHLLYCSLTQWAAEAPLSEVLCGMISYSAEDMRTKKDIAFTKPRVEIISFEKLTVGFGPKVSFNLICVLDCDVYWKQWNLVFMVISETVSRTEWMFERHLYHPTNKVYLKLTKADTVFINLSHESRNPFLFHCRVY